MLSLRRMNRRVRKIPELQWTAEMSDAIQSGLAVFLTSGAFVGIAFQPMFWYFVSMGISLRAYVWRVEQLATKPQDVGWRAGGQTGIAGIGVPAAGVPAWRKTPL